MFTILIFIFVIIFASFYTHEQSNKTLKNHKLYYPNDLLIAKEKNIWLLLAICGKVFNVSSGNKFYGRDGPYSAFAYTDSCFSYAKGEFLNDNININDLSNEECETVGNWIKFYSSHSNYSQVGILVGRFYDDKGIETDDLKYLNNCISTNNDL
jgi:hypothetical protein